MWVTNICPIRVSVRSKPDDALKGPSTMPGRGSPLKAGQLWSLCVGAWPGASFLLFYHQTTTPGLAVSALLRSWSSLESWHACTAEHDVRCYGGWLLPFWEAVDVLASSHHQLLKTRCFCSAPYWDQWSIGPRVQGSLVRCYRLEGGTYALAAWPRGVQGWGSLWGRSEESLRPTSSGQLSSALSRTLHRPGSE